MTTHNTQACFRHLCRGPVPLFLLAPILFTVRAADHAPGNGLVRAATPLQSSPIDSCIVEQGLAQAPLSDPLERIPNNSLEKSASRWRRISGFIRDPRGTAEAGIVISANKGGDTTVSDRDGRYQIRVPADWSGVVTPQHKEYTFDPPKRAFSLVKSDLADVDFTARHDPVTISGRVTAGAGKGLAETLISAEGNGPYASDRAACVTNEDGGYTLHVPYHWSGTIRPAKAQYSFIPDQRTYTNAISNHAEQHYTAEVSGSLPVADSMSVATDEDKPVSITLSGHDPDQQSLTFRILQSPLHGSLDTPRLQAGLPVAKASVVYAPTIDYNGEDTFTYVVDDGSQTSEPAVVTLSIKPVPDPPRAHASTITSTPSRPIVITLSGNDPDGDALTYTIVAQPEHGILTGTPPNLIYTSKGGYDADVSTDTTIYVDGQITRSSCQNYDPETRACRGGAAQAYRSLAAAADVAVAGQTVVIREGTYKEQLAPRNSGAPGRVITFRGRQGHDRFSFKVNDGHFDSEPAMVSIELAENVLITGPELDPAVHLSNKSYIVLDGLQVENVDRWLHAVQAHHNTIHHCRFNRAINRAGSSKTGLFFQDATFNKILGNTLTDTTSDNLALVHSDRNLVEGNTITKAAHTLWAIKCGNFNVIRNNYFHNERQKIGEIYDCHDVGFNHEYYIYDATKFNLIEGNVFAYTPSSGNHSPYAGIQYAGQNGILRRNRFYDTVGPGLDLTLYPHEATFNTDNRIFHNVFYSTSFAGLSLTAGDKYPFAGQVVVNNIFLRSVFVANDKRWKRYTEELDGKPVQIMTAGLAGFLVTHNCLFYQQPEERYLIVHGNRGQSKNSKPFPLSEWQRRYPNLFRDNLEIDPEFKDETNKDFHLKDGSPMIDAGAFLTRTVGDGQGARLPVEDVGYFYDGFGIPGETGDLIRLEGDDRVARIVGIDYTDHALWLDQELSWNAGQGVTLNHAGRAPDIGAFEYLPDGHWPPIATFTIRPGSENPLEIELDAEASYDPGGATLAYDWDFGNGEQASGDKSRITYAYALPGTYTICLTVAGKNAPERKMKASRSFRVGRAELFVEPDQLDLGPSLTEGLLAIRNQGEGTLAYHLTGSAPWLTMSQTSGALTDSVSIRIQVNRDGLKPGDYRDKLMIDGGSAGRKEVPIGMEVPAVRQEALIRPGDEWRYFKGVQEPPKDWAQPDFDDTEWLKGSTGIGYSNDMPYATKLNDMPGNYVSFYTRCFFRIEDPSLYPSLTLGMVYDDGFVAYLNGVEIVRSPGMGSPAVPLNHKTTTAKEHDEEAPETLFMIPVKSGLLKQGTNVLAIQVHNSYIASGDCGMVPRLLAGRIIKDRTSP